jgi:hypothetical protein
MQLRKNIGRITVSENLSRHHYRNEPERQVHLGSSSARSVRCLEKPLPVPGNGKATLSGPGTSEGSTRQYESPQLARDGTYIERGAACCP